MVASVVQIDAAAGIAQRMVDVIADAVDGTLVGIVVVVVDDMLVVALILHLLKVVSVE